MDFSTKPCVSLLATLAPVVYETIKGMQEFTFPRFISRVFCCP